MDGSITVTSEEGIGTSFDVRLKIQPCQPGEIRELASQEVRLLWIESVDCGG